MKLEVAGIEDTSLTEYERIPSSFVVHEVFDVMSETDGRFVLTQRKIDTPFRKDYDLADDSRPTQWPTLFDLRNWAFISVSIEGTVVGRAALLWDSPDIEMLQDEHDSAILWDIRVDPGYRKRGVGSTLFRAAEDLARSNGLEWLKVETQNVNVPACELYARHGCVLQQANYGVYAEYPDEVQLLWRKDLRETV